MSYLLGEANSTQINKVESWINISEENKTYLQELEDLWLETGKISPAPVAVDSTAAWNKVSDIIDFESENKYEIKPKKNISYKYILRIAAVFLILFGISMIFLVDNETEKVLLAKNEIHSGILPDGSAIDLNKNSELVYPESFSKTKRVVKLQGEAFFNVKKEKESPFIVEMEGGYVEVLGTSFNIKAKPDNKSIEVYVKTGTVKLYSISQDQKNTSFVIIDAGKKGIIDKTNEKAFEIENKGTNSNDVFWLNKEIVFEDAELQDVAKTLKDIFNVDIKFNNEQSKTRKYNGTFENDPIEQIIFVISESFEEVELKKENKTYVFTEK